MKGSSAVWVQRLGISDSFQSLLQLLDFPERTNKLQMICDKSIGFDAEVADCTSLMPKQACRSGGGAVGYSAIYTSVITQALTDSLLLRQQTLQSTNSGLLHCQPKHPSLRLDVLRLEV